MSNQADERFAYAMAGAAGMMILYYWWVYILALVIAWSVFTLWTQHHKHR